MELKQLNHIVVGDRSSGRIVVILDNGAVISAEDDAMLQSLYSRDPSPVFAHVEKCQREGSGKFMDQYYVGYGHKSIGDCGDTTIYIEKVSMLDAKAVQDWMLYSGQEVSTRYVDFSNAPFVSPLRLSDNPQEWLRAFYVKAKPILVEDLKRRYPRHESEKEGFYDKAINARAFDILRSFLPAGAATSLSWKTNLRQAADKLSWLRWHPLAEVRETAAMIEEAVKQAHPNSFNAKRYPASEDYREMYMNEEYYFVPDIMGHGMFLTRNSLDPRLLTQYSKWFELRPEKTELPKQLAEIGTLQIEFTLDFGSFRDIQRQRAVIQRMGLLTIDYGFHSWYLEQLSSELRDEAEVLLGKIESWYKVMSVDQPEEVLQYYLPMGFRVPCRVSGDLPALVYLVELRSGGTVHPTLRAVAQDMGRMITDAAGIKLHVDYSDSGRFDVKRGAQDIVAKS